MMNLRVMLAVFAIWGGCVAQPAQAQSRPVDEVKAGFVLNFIRYASGMGPSSGPLQVCGLSAHPLDGKLLALEGRPTDAGTLIVRAPVAQSEWKSCQVVFVSSEDAVRLRVFVAEMAGKPILTIGDVPGFAESGGMIELKLRSERVRFVVNHGALKSAGLRVSSQLLKLADEVMP